MSRQRTTVYKRYRIFLVNFPTASIASAPATDLLHLGRMDHVVGLQRDPVHEVGSANHIITGGSSPWSHITARAIEGLHSSSPGVCSAPIGRAPGRDWRCPAYPRRRGSSNTIAPGLRRAAPRAPRYTR